MSPAPGSRLGRAVRWLAPSAACACIGALAAGLLEARGREDALGLAAAVGFLALIVFPVLFGLSVVARGVYAGWQPRDLAASVVEEGGGAPRLAGWLVVILLGALLAACAAFQGTWLLAAWTAFKPLTISFAAPIISVLAALVAVAVSRPAARLVAHGVRRLDARWRRTGRGTLLRPRVVFAVAIGLALVTTYVLWRLMVKRRIGPIDTSLLHAPAIALAATLAAHAAWYRLPRARVLVGMIAGVVTASAITVAVVAVRARPTTTLEVWGDQPLAGIAIERLFDLDAIRANISLAGFRPTDRPGAEHPDIILVTLDTVRADHTPPYGGNADMPVLRELGQRGTVYLWAFAPSNVTRRSIPSMVTGLQPNRVRGRVVGWALRVDPRHVLLAERLRAGGYETAGFMCCKGFWGAEARTGLARGLEHVTIEQNGMRLAKAARAWLDARERQPNNRPLFLWMHILEPHNWTGGGVDPKDPVERGRMYDRALTGVDAMMLQLFGAFTERRPERAPIAIITADHGEALGEHGAPYHSTDLYNSQIRVPLVIAGPGIKPQRVAETVSLTDLTPTIVELAGFEPPPRDSTMDGRSLADLATGARVGSPDDGVAFAAMIKDRSNPGGVTAIIKGPWKLIDNGVSLELYDIKSDPGERQNLIGQKPEIAEELKKLLAVHAR
ncbi:MAG: sulfatase-like hydrolase/transferase [Myxococcota bacterium]|nr:sulfatase-like hydrolase/transferase [Myxococcota bacterium]